MMRKVVVFITLLCIVLSCIPVNAETEAGEQSSEYEENMELLEAIGALSDVDYGEQRILTRAEFAELITRVAGYDQLIDSEQSTESAIDLSFLTEKGWVYVPTGTDDGVVLDTNTPFADVSSDDDAWRCIEFVTTVGFMSADGTTYFRPHDNVTGHEILRAMSIFLNLGAGQTLTTLEHSQKAVTEGLLSQVSEKDMTRPLRMKDIVVILINTLQAEPYILEFEGTNRSYYQRNDYLLMNQLYDTYTEQGVVNATEYAALKSYKTTVKGYVVIGDAYYQVENFDVDKLLGYKLEIYYTEEDNDRKVVYYKEKIDADDLLTIEADDIVSFENHIFKYSDGNRIKSITVNSDVSVVYNGASIDSYTDEAFTPKNGTVVFMKTGNSSSYNLAKIMKYDTMIVKNVDYQNELILADVGDIKRFSTDDFDEIEYFMPDGTEVVFATISRDIVLSIASTLPGQMERCRVIVSNNTVNGTLERLNGADETVIIDGNEYEYNSELVDFRNVLLGADITLYLDGQGIVVAYRGKIGSGAQYGYLRKVTYDEVDENLCYIRIYTVDDTFVTYTVSDRVKLNGRSIKVEKIRNFLLDESGVTKYQVIQYWVDDTDNLIEICTADGKEGAFSKYDIAALGVSEVTHRNGALLSFANEGFTAFLNTVGGYVAFSIPTDKEDNENYGIIKNFGHEKKYTFDELYLSSPDSRFIDVCVQLDATVENTFDSGAATPYMMVSEIKCSIDEENELYYEINGYDTTAAVSYRCYDEDLFDVCNALGNGDIVRLNLNGIDNSVMWIEKFYDASEKRMTNGATRYGDNLHPYELYSGWAVESTDSDQILLVHRFTYTDGKPDLSASQAAYKKDGARMFKYPTRIICYNSGVNRVSLGSKQDVVCSENNQTGSTVLIGSYYENAQVMFVIR